MATDTKLVQGEVTENPETASEADVEALLLGFLRSLLDEQCNSKKAVKQNER